MLPALVSLKGLIKPKSYHIDHLFFRLHYQVTVCLLLGFCLVLTAKVLFGDVIDCQSRTLGRDQYYDNWCYSRGTYTELAPDVEALEKAIALANKTREELIEMGRSTPTTTEAPNLVTMIANTLLKSWYNESDEHVTTEATPLPTKLPLIKEIPKPPYGVTAGSKNLGGLFKTQFKKLHAFIKSTGVGVSYNIAYMIPGIPVPNGREEHHTQFSHAYYQYIPVILFLQAVCFYAPHYLWKSWENGVVSSVCKQIYDHRFSPSDYFDTNYYIIDYLQNAFFTNRALVYKYYLCHLLMLVNVIAQIIILDAIFNNQFITYGLDMIEYAFIDDDVYGLRDFFTQQPEKLNNPMDFVFPKVTNCRFVNLGDGNSPNELYFACVLPLNMFHDKFFLILWFWLLMLVTLTVMQILFDFLYAFIPTLRKHLFVKRFGPILGNGKRHPSSLTELFLLDLIGNSSDKFAFAALLRKLSKDEQRQSLV